jgi:DNA-binding CsgD family transcriptional regulator
MIPSLDRHDSEAAMTGPAAVAIVLSDRERGELEARVRRRKIARADAMRAEIVLLAADGLNNCAIADEIGASRMTVLTWRKRFAAQPRRNRLHRRLSASQASCRELFPE